MADKIVFGVEFDAKTGQAQLKQFIDGFEKVGNSAKLAGEKSKRSFGDAISGVERFSNLLSNLKGAFSQVFNSFSEAVGYSNQYETALTGLAKTAENFAQSQLEAKKAAIELSKDGLVNVTANATSLKFLMQSGFDLAQALNITTAAKDMGAFGRTTLDFNQAMIDFARGVKTGSLELTENIGFTQRFSAIMKQANVDISNGIDLRNNLAQREAFYNAVLKEGELNKGNAQKYLETTAGAMASMGTQINILKKELGDFVKIIISDMLPSLKSLVSWLKDNLAVVVAGLAASIATVLIPVIYSTVSAVIALGVQMGIATAGITTLIGVIATFAAYKFADTMIENAKATERAAVAMDQYAESVKKLNMEQSLKEISQLTALIELQEKRNTDLYEQRAKQLKEINHLEKIRAFGLQDKKDEADFTKALIDGNSTLLQQSKAKLELAKQQRDEIIKARSKTNDPKVQTDADKKAIDEKLKLEYDAMIESMNLSFESAEYERELNAQKLKEQEDLNESIRSGKFQLAKDEIQAEKEKTDQIKTIQAELAEAKRIAEEQFRADNALTIELAQIGYQSLTAGISSFIQVGVQGGNALKAAWQSFSSSILSMISQMIAKIIALKIITSTLNFFSPGLGTAVGGLIGEQGGLPSQFRPKLAGGGVLWQGASHSNGGIPVEVEGDEITLTKGVYRNPVLRGIASMINVAAGGVQIPNAPRASQLAAGGLPALSPSGASSDNSAVMAMVTTLASTVTGLTSQINRLQSADPKQVFTLSENGKNQINALV